MTKQWYQTKEGWQQKQKEYRKTLDTLFPDNPANTTAKPMQPMPQTTRKVRPSDLVGSVNRKTGHYEPSKTIKDIAATIKDKS